MAILVDPPMWPGHGRWWSHLASDESVAELHAFAGRMGVPARGFEGDHYDIPQERYRHAVQAGAVPVSCRELLSRLQQSGLRRQKRRGERVLASAPGLGVGERVDALLSAHRPTGAVAAVQFVVGHGSALLMLPADSGFSLPRVEIAPSDGLIDSAEQLVSRARRAAGELFGHGWTSAPARQLGYLRTVRPASPGVFEVVVRVAGAPNSMPELLNAGRARVGPAQWVDAREGAARLPDPVAALVRAR